MKRLKTSKKFNLRKSYFHTNVPLRKPESLFETFRSAISGSTQNVNGAMDFKESKEFITHNVGKPRFQQIRPGLYKRDKDGMIKLCPLDAKELPYYKTEERCSLTYSKEQTDYLCSLPPRMVDNYLIKQFPWLLILSCKRVKW